MKKLIIPVALCCALMACGGAKTNNSASADNQQESAAESTVSATKADPYTMVDGKQFDLKGKVKSCDIYEYNSGKDGVPLMEELIDESHFEFDNGDGFCTKNSNRDFWTPKRNGMGQVRAYSSYIEEYQCDIWDSLFYNEAGFVEKRVFEGIEGFGEYTYEYSGDILEREVLESAGEGECGFMESIYTIQEADDHGNWTSRLVRIDNYEWDDGDEKPSEPNSFGYTVQIRKIVYY